MEIAGRIAVVTGAAHRIGRGIALALAEAGADVVVHHHRSTDAAADTVAEIEGLGRRAVAVQVDLSAANAPQELLGTVEERLGQTSILVNSASGFPIDGFEDVTPDEWNTTLSLSLTSPVFLTQAFAARLSDGTNGAVVNVGDVKTSRPYRRHFSYMVAKGALETVTRAAALALAPRVRVNMVALGVVLPPAEESAVYAEQLAADLPLRRVGGADTVGDAVAALVRNDFITGEIVRLDGGAHLV